MFQNNPTRLPTSILCCMGTTVKLTMLTSGHNFHPVMINGNISCFLDQ